MRIAIEAQRIFRQKKHGMDFVALELIKNLMKIDTKNEYFVFVAPGPDKCVESKNNFQIIELDGGIYPLWEQIALPKAVKKYQCEILECTSNTAPLKIHVPLVILLHDIIYMESQPIFSKGYSLYQKFGNIYRRFIVPRVLKKAKKIITVSHFEKNRIANFFKLEDERVTAIYNGVSEHFQPIEEDEKKIIKKKYNLPDKYIFFLGNTDPKKNTGGVIEAYSQLTKQIGTDIKLLMLDFDQQELNKLITETENEDIRTHILLAGYVQNTDLPAIYGLSELFLYPSYRESFGIPMLEAMACACPVITSNTSSMPEVSGDAAIIIDPYKPSEICKAMLQILNDENLKQSLIMKGLERAKFFSWHKMAIEHLGIYEDISENDSNLNRYGNKMMFI